MCGGGTEGTLAAADSGGHIQLDHAGVDKHKAVDLLLERLDGRTLRTLDLAEGSCRILEETLDLIVEEDGVSIGVSREHGLAFLDGGINANGSDLFFCTP